MSEPDSDSPGMDRMEALKLANRIRSERSQLKRDLKTGKINIYRLLKEPPECIIHMHIVDLLKEVPKFGQSKTTRALRMSHTSPTTKIENLTERQLDELTWAIRRQQPK